MRVLRLTNSSDFAPGVPAALGSAAIAEEAVVRATGEQVETVMRVFWPSPALPGIVERWLARYEPDVVFIRASSFWVSYESVPLRVQRLFGPAGRWSGSLALRVGGHPRVAANPAVRVVRQFAARTLGGDPYFSPEEAAGHVESLLRAALSRESAVVVVRGPGHTFDSSGTVRGFERARRRTDELDERLRELCAKLHVSYVPVRDVVDQPEYLLGDGIHENAAGQRVFGELEGEAIARSWLLSTARV